MWVLGPPRGLSSWGGPGLRGDIPLSPSCLATGRVCLWTLLMAPPAPQLEGPQGVRSFLCKERTGPASWVTREIECSRGCLGSFHQHSTVQEEWGQSLTCAIFYPEMLLSWVVLTCWGMPLEDATLNNADGAVARKQKRLNVLLSCWDPHGAWLWMVSELPGVGLSVKMASCKLTPFLASHVSLLKASCRN